MCTRGQAQYKSVLAAPGVLTQTEATQVPTTAELGAPHSWDPSSGEPCHLRAQRHSLELAWDRRSTVSDSDLPGWEGLHEKGHQWTTRPDKSHLSLRNWGEAFEKCAGDKIGQSLVNFLGNSKLWVLLSSSLPG